MDKITYLAELAEGLARWVPERERQDILRYYAEYFEEAGPGREAEVVAELGDPWALSCRLAVEGGYVTHEKAASWRPRKAWPKVLIGTAVGLSIFALFAGIGLLFFNFVGFNPIRSAVVAASEPDQVTIVDWGQAPFLQEATGYTEFYYTDAGNLEGFDAIDVDISFGNIEVVYADDYTLSINRSEAMSGYDLTWEIRDGVLRLRDGGGSQSTQVNSWSDLKNLFGAGQLSVNVTITVPETAATMNGVSVRTGLGNVMLWGVHAETVTAETGVGNVECFEAWNAKKLELTTGVGDVTLGMSWVRDGRISLESGTGDVEVNLACSEDDCAYELESGLGLVSVNGAVRGSSAERKGNLPYRLNAESGTGSVNVWFNG